MIDVFHAYLDAVAARRDGGVTAHQVWALFQDVAGGMGPEIARKWQVHLENERRRLQRELQRIRKLQNSGGPRSPSAQRNEPPRVRDSVVRMFREVWHGPERP